MYRFGSGSKIHEFEAFKGGEFPVLRTSPFLFHPSAGLCGRREDS